MKQDLDDDVTRWTSEIRTLAETHEPKYAAERIDELRERVETVCLAAEARLRTLLGSLDALELADEPAWLANAARSLMDRGADAAAVDSACKLCRALLAVKSDLTAELDIASSAVVEVAWNVPSRLTWIVRAPRHRWPGVVVRSYVRENATSPKMKVRSTLLAHRVIEMAGASLE